MVALKYKDPADGLYKLVPVGLSTSAADTRYVNVAGDTMTGNLSLQSQYPAVSVDAQDPTTIQADYNWRRLGIQRWTFRMQTAETGSGNTGSDLRLIARADDGNSLVATAMTIKRSTGLITLAGDPTAALGIATKQYVDGYTTTIGDGTALSYTVTHNLNTQNCHVTVRQTATPFERIDCVVRFATVNTVTIVLLTAPAAGAYTVTVSR